MKDKPLQYLCSTYTIHPNGYAVAYTDACTLLGKLLNKGYRVFSPIAHCHIASVLEDIPQDFDWWMEYDEGFIDKCDSLLVATMEGWEDSKGITHEIAYARSKGMKVEYIDPETLKIRGYPPISGDGDIVNYSYVPVALDKQVAGEHYKGMAIQPIEFCERNKLSACVTHAIGYLVRHQSKGGVEDLDKAIHMIEILKEIEYGS